MRLEKGPTPTPSAGDIFEETSIRHREWRCSLFKASNDLLVECAVLTIRSVLCVPSLLLLPSAPFLPVRRRNSNNTKALRIY